MKIRRTKNEIVDGISLADVKRKFVMRMDGRIEILCEHGIGHPTYASAEHCAKKFGEIKPDKSNEQSVINAWMVHGCDGCCANYEECRIK